MRFSWLCVPALVALFAVPGAARAHTAADYAAAVRKVEQMVAGQGFTVLLEKPFVVAGDEEADVVLTRSESTVRWAVRKLKQSYFTRDPNHILTVWLFKDEVSYRKHAKKLFGHTPTTPFGYYSSTAKALIMNISTGGGTLVHEIVHPFMESNFPSCPAWFNEALGSLYEQCAERGGKIAGLTNWRLAGLQRAIRAGTVPVRQMITHRLSLAETGLGFQLVAEAQDSIKVIVEPQR